MLMLKRAIKYLWRPPRIPDDPPRALQALVLHRVLMLVGATLILISALIPSFALNVSGSHITAATMLAVILVSYVILQRGFVELAARVAVTFTWLNAVGFVAISGGMSSSGVVYLVAVITMSGLLLGQKGMYTVTLATVIVATLMFIAELMRFTFPQVLRITAGTGWIALCVSAVATTTLINFSIRTLQTALTQSANQMKMRAQAQTELERIAITDSLTGLFNRRYFFERVEQLLPSALEEKSSVALIMIDVDHFKNINDTYGHTVGDRVMKHVVAALVSRVRTADIMARYGGEEFVLFLKDVGSRGALALAERMRAQVEETPYPLGEGNIPTTISVGITICDTSRENPVLDDLIVRADRALYAAKQNGRNRCELAEPLESTD